MAKKKGEAAPVVENEELETADDGELVEMIGPDGTHLEVHPTCVKAHIDKGWRHA
jgi:hypothetical protein